MINDNGGDDDDDHNEDDGDLGVFAIFATIA